MTDDQAERAITMLEAINDRLLALTRATEQHTKAINGQESAMKTIATLLWMHGCRKDTRDFERYGDGS